MCDCTHSAGTKTKKSIVKEGGTIFVYDKNYLFVNTFLLLKKQVDILNALIILYKTIQKAGYCLKRSRFYLNLR